MELTAPTPSVRDGSYAPAPVEVGQTTARHASAVSVTLAGCGGCGINLARAFKNDVRLDKVYNFDTSMANAQDAEKVNVLVNGSGSGSHRAENAMEIERVIPQLSDDHMGVNDVAIVVHSLGGGSGSVIGPLMIRDYVKRGVKPIAVVVADTSSYKAAVNTLNTLKTLNSICKNNNIRLPTIVLSNDLADRRGDIDSAAKQLIATLIGLLTAPVREIDRNDRLNFLDPSKAIDVNPGIKILSLDMFGVDIPTKLLLGATSKEMVDSLLILQSSPDESLFMTKPPARLAKTGFFQSGDAAIVGRISSDVADIDKVIDHVEKMQTLEKAQKHKTVDRLDSGGDEDMIL